MRSLGRVVCFVQTCQRSQSEYSQYHNNTNITIQGVSSHSGPAASSTTFRHLVSESCKLQASTEGVIIQLFSYLLKSSYHCAVLRADGPFLRSGQVVVVNIFSLLPQEVITGLPRDGGGLQTVPPLRAAPPLARAAAGLRPGHR